jgi:hypothetical protein
MNFIDMVNVAKTRFIGEGYEGFIKLIPSVKSFVFMGNSTVGGTPGEITVDDRQGMDIDLDLPFPIVSIEINQGFMTVPAPDCYKNKEYFIISIVVHELSPKVYDYYLYISHPINGIFVTKMSSPLNGLIVERFLNRLKTENMGSVKSNERVKVKIDGVKTIHKIKEVVYVMPKKQRGEFEKGSRGPVDWSYSFWVRGHWRVFDGIGKDRHDNYCVQGYTWVRHHVRGDGPLVDKKFVVKGSYENKEKGCIQNI